MNNSLARLIDGMEATLRTEIVPRIDGEFARGQAFGVIYMLKSIRLRADWSPAFLGEQLAALEELARTLAPHGLDAELVPQAAAAILPDPRALEAVRDDGDRRVCALIDWLDDHRGALAVPRAAAIDGALRHYLNRQLRWELSTSAKPMFAEISSGTD
jgi:hypothetical protein